MVNFEVLLLDYLKEMRRLTNYIWFKGETPEDIYVENFEILTKEFEANFNSKLDKNSHFDQKSTIDTIGSLDFN